MGEERRRGEMKQSGGSLECGKSRVDAHAVSPSLRPSLPPSLIYTCSLTHSASLQQRKLIGWSQN